ncbi:12112_t:CDS:1, partial [Acaulospora morrowiae]
MSNNRRKRRISGGTGMQGKEDIQYATSRHNQKHKNSCLLNEISLVIIVTPRSKKEKAIMICVWVSGLRHTYVNAMMD